MFFPFYCPRDSSNIDFYIFTPCCFYNTDIPWYSDVVLFLGQNICYNIAGLEKKNNPISGLIYEKKLT